MSLTPEEYRVRRQREQGAERQRRYYVRNTEKMQEKAREYYYTHKVEINTRRRERRKKERESAAWQDTED